MTFRHASRLALSSQARSLAQAPATSRRLLLPGHPAFPRLLHTIRLLESTAGRELIPPRRLDEDSPPRYAILSHTWGADKDEVTYQDLTASTARGKTGVRKLDFCAEQARQDGLKFFWMDTCCIDKRDSVELNTAITSMFRWYQTATKCYVYLSDVPRAQYVDQAFYDEEQWTSDFRRCKWLTRGWALQEMLAPKVVEFYDKFGTKLGDKATLEQHICDVTGIPAEALQGNDLSSFSMEDRLSWQQSRQTKNPEDLAYSLAGICDVTVIPAYGEGGARAMARLRREIGEALKSTPRHHFAIPLSLAGVAEAPKFVGREKELDEIHASLAINGGRRTVVLHGLGGIGKTQMAVAYAKRHRDTYSAIFWFNIRDETSIKRSFATAARRILQHHPSAYRLSKTDLDGNPDDVVEAVNVWLSQADNTRWLAIYDNYDNPKIPTYKSASAVDIERFLPTAYQGAVLITTRSSQVRNGRSIAAKKLTHEHEALEVLSSMSRRDLSIEDEAVLDLIRRLDGLPLALATAGAYLDQVSITVAEYLRLYEDSWRQLHAADAGLDSYEDRTLYSTWHVSLDQIRSHNELSAKLLGLWCYFSNQDLWYELLRAGASEDVPWIQNLTIDLHVFTNAMRLLCQYGLVEIAGGVGKNVESVGYSMHSCVHSWATHVLNGHWDPALARYAIQATARHAPRHSSPEAWLVQRRLLPHAEKCAQYLQTGLVRDTGPGLALDRLGQLFSDQAKFAESAVVQQLLVKSTEANLGADHQTTLRSVSRLGTVYKDQGKLVEAEALYLRALKGMEKTSEMGDVPWILNNLGDVYAAQGRLAEAEAMYIRAVETETPLAVNLVWTRNLGRNYRRQGKLDRAEETFRRILDVAKQSRVAARGLISDTLASLGDLYKIQKRLAEAEEVYRQAIQGYQREYGIHRSLFSTLRGLAHLYRQQGKLAEAEETYQQAIEGQESAFGADHRYTLGAVSELGALYKDQGHLPKAEEMYRRVVQGKERTLGPDHPSTRRAARVLRKLCE